MLSVDKQEAGRHSAPEPTGPSVSQWSGSAREQAVQRMFTSIAGFYDLNNSLLSFGLHHRWKQRAVSLIPNLNDIAASDRGQALDIGAGTGDLALLLSPRMGSGGHVLATDLNAAMLRKGAGKIARRGLDRHITCLQGTAEQLACQSGSFDTVMTGFCMRNVGDLTAALVEIRRVLKPGGSFVCLEFSRPVHGWLRRLYDWYSFTLLPWMGTKVAGDRTGVYEYLPASIRGFPDQERLSDRLRESGFCNVHYHNLTGGIVAVHVATKSSK